jgi:hypothetical protein
MEAKDIARSIADLRAEKKALEDREKGLRAQFEEAYPPGSAVPEDFAVSWEPRNELECRDIATVDASLTRKVLDSSKVRAYRELFDGLPDGVIEKPNFILAVRKAG